MISLFHETSVLEKLADNVALEQVFLGYFGV
jgi:hypothetical protein